MNKHHEYRALGKKARNNRADSRDARGASRHQENRQKPGANREGLQGNPQQGERSPGERNPGLGREAAGRQRAGQQPHRQRPTEQLTPTKGQGQEKEKLVPISRARDGAVPSRTSTPVKRSQRANMQCTFCDSKQAKRLRATDGYVVTACSDCAPQVSRQDFELA